MTTLRQGVGWTIFLGEIDASSKYLRKALSWRFGWVRWLLVAMGAIRRWAAARQQASAKNLGRRKRQWSKKGGDTPGGSKPQRSFVYGVLEASKEETKSIRVKKGKDEKIVETRGWNEKTWEVITKIGG